MPRPLPCAVMLAGSPRCGWRSGGRSTQGAVLMATVVATGAAVAVVASACRRLTVLSPLRMGRHCRMTIYSRRGAFRGGHASKLRPIL